MTSREQELDAQALTHFRNDTKDHVMRVLRDDGVYRHLVFKKPGTSNCWYEIITTPGLLTINGDMGTYVFSRIDDMFQFFRREPGEINPNYWAEKMLAGDCVSEYEPELFHEQVVESFADWAEYEAESQEQRDNVWSDLELEVLDDYEDEQYARRNLDEFRPTIASDTWEWDFKQYTSHFRWNLHAIVHGIRRYDRVIGSIA